MAHSQQPIKEYSETFVETQNVGVREITSHPIYGLQMNISGKKQGLKNCIKFLLEGFLKRSRRDVFPCPTFVALHDGAKKADCQIFQRAFNVQDDSGADLERFDSPASDDVHLLYDRNIVICLAETDEDVLAQADFFKNETGDKCEQLFKRIAGGLFQHKASAQYIVAISYHGIHVSTTNQDKEKYLEGMFSDLPCI
jgi:hypothetical protein